MAQDVTSCQGCMGRKPLSKRQEPILKLCQNCHPISLDIVIIRPTSHHIKICHSTYYLMHYLPNLYLFICTFYAGENYSSFFNSWCASNAYYSSCQMHCTIYYLFHYLLTFYPFICNFQWFYQNFRVAWEENC